MDSARWELVQSLFHRAADLAAPDQREFLRIACVGDQTLVDDVVRMLVQDARQASLLDRDIAYAAGPIVHDAAPAAAPDQPFGPYRLVRLLGEGGAGVVYLAARDDLTIPARIDRGSVGPARCHATNAR
jgi:hypothetical protein